MEYAKKMFLVEPRMLSTRQCLPAEESATPTWSSSQSNDLTAGGLSNSFQQILKRNDMTEDQKVKLYDNYLQQFLNRIQKDGSGQTAAVALNDASTKSSESLCSNDESKQLESEIVNSAPKNLQKQARLLMQRLKEATDMGWTAKGELILDGTTIPNTNIVDLINDLLRKRKGNGPEGWEQLITKLKAHNIPHELVRNPDRLKYLFHNVELPTPSKISPSTIRSVIRSMKATPSITLARRVKAAPIKRRPKKGASIMKGWESL